MKRGHTLLILSLLFCFGLGNTATCANANNPEDLVKIIPMHRQTGFDASINIAPTFEGLMIHTIICVDKNLSFDDFQCLCNELGYLGYQYLIDRQGRILELAPMVNGSYVAVYGNGWGVFPGETNRSNMNFRFVPVGIIRAENGSINKVQMQAIANLTVYMAAKYENFSYAIGANATGGYRMNEVPIKYENGTVIANNNSTLLVYNPTGLSLPELNRLSNIAGKPFGIRFETVYAKNSYDNPQLGLNQSWDAGYLQRLS